MILKGLKKEKGFPKSAFNPPFIYTLGVIANQSLSMVTGITRLALPRSALLCTPISLLVLLELKI